MKSPYEELRPAQYQLVPLAKLLASSIGGILVADGVGVGKTVSAGYVVAYSLSRLGTPAFVVCSPTLISKWLLELRGKFGIVTIPVRSLDDLDTAREETRHRKSSTRPPVYVMSNSLLAGAKSALFPPVSVTVFDEIHTYRNHRTRWYKGCKQLAMLSTFRIGLSATPINNSLEDLVSELSILIPGYSLEVTSAVVNDLWNSKRSVLTDSVTTRFLKEKLGVHFVKRDVSEIQVTYPDSYARQVVTAVDEKMGPRTLLEKITYYRLAASSPFAFWSSFGRRDLLSRDDPKVDALNRTLSDDSVTHWLVFCEFTGTVELLSRKIDGPEVFTMTGDTPIFERDSFVKSFRMCPRGVLLLTSVGSEGLDFQFCEGIVNYDLHWNPMKLEQRAGRVDRIGQNKPSVRIVNFHVSNSIDERVISVMKRKLEVVSSSVFAPGPILSNKSEESDRVIMYNEESVTHELESGASLVDSFTLNNSLETRDYKALRYVDQSFCNPAKLMKTAHRIGAESIVADAKWVGQVRQHSHSLQQLLKYFV